MPTVHDSLTGPDALHPPAFVSATDPADTPANYVGADKWWLDTSGASAVLKYRNAANDAWVSVTTLDHGTLGGLADDDHPQYAKLSLVDATGDLLVGSAADTVARLAVGASNGYILTVDSGETLGMAWKTPPATLANPMTAAEDLVVGGVAGAPARLGVGSAGQVLTVVAGVLTWATPAPSSAALDDLTDVGAPTPSDGDVLTWDSTPGEWVNAAPAAPSHAIESGTHTTAGGTDGYALRQTGATTFGWEADHFSLFWVLGDGTNAITTSEPVTYLPAPAAGVIVEATVLADASGSIVVDVWKDTYASFPPTVADTITASAKPTISSATKTTDTGLTGWTTTVAAGDVLAVKVDSASVVKRCTVVLRVRKT